MNYWHFIIFALTILSMIFFLFMNLSFIQAYLISVLFILIIYFVIALIRGKILSYLLNEACDPVKYLKRIRKQEIVMKRKPKYLAFLAINKAAAYIVLGEYEKARSLLDAID